VEDTGAFKTPTLRDVSRRAPYMHDGSVATLREAVATYDRGGGPRPAAAPSSPRPRCGSGRR
jgi:cytochrome c peroxidase